MGEEKYCDKLIKMINSSHKNREVDRERITFLYKLLPMAFIMSPILSGIVTFINWGVINHTVLITWTLLIVVVSFWRYLLFKKFFKESSTPEQFEQWDLYFFIGVVLLGILWGGGGLFLSTSGSFVHQLFIILILAGLMTGSFGTYAVDMKCFLTYAIMSFLPILISFLFIPDKMHIIIAIVMILYFMTAVATAKRINKMIISVFKLQAENKALITNLASEKERIEKLNLEYQQEIEQRKQAEENSRKHMEETEDLNRMLLGRESKMAELKKEIADLRSRLGNNSQ